MDLEDEILMQEWEDDSSFVDFDILSALEASKNGIEPQLSEKGERFLQQMDEDLDFAFALSLQTQYDEELKENASNNVTKSTIDVASGSKPVSIIDEVWELIDPHPDIHALFLEYDQKFFYGKLKGVEVRWSPRMTLCAGVCSYEGRGGLCSVRLSEPLLKLRPRKDLVETLLHEMIHAYLFVTNNNKDRDGHGPEFLSHMNRINRETGTKISVYHSFHDEVDLYRQHWWKCDGPCLKRRPFFGLVKRTMNRAPGPNDNWWASHQTSCGGKFTKIREPDNYNKKKPTKRKLSSASDNKESSSDIRSFMKDGSSSFGKGDNSKPTARSLKDKSSSSGKLINSKSTAETLKDSNLSTGKGDNSQSSFKSSNISDFKTLMSKENNLVSVNQNRMSEKKNFTPFQGTGFKLGGSSEKSALSSKFSSAYDKSSMPSSSGIEQKPTHATYAKLPRISNSSEAGSVPKGQASHTSNKSATKMIQSPIEKFLSPKIESGNSKPIPKKIDFIDLCESPKETIALKVQCPVCSTLVKEDDINTHLDNCLFKK